MGLNTGNSSDNLNNNSDINYGYLYGSGTDSFENEDEIKRLLYDADKYIKAEYEKQYGPHLFVYCRPIKTVNDLIETTRKLLEKQRKRCLVSIQTSYILKQIDTSEYFLIYGSSNTSLTLEAIKMRHKNDIKKILRILHEHDWQEFFTVPK